MGSSMKSQIFVAIGVLIATSALVTGLASTIYAQSNTTGGNMTGATSTEGDGDMVMMVMGMTTTMAETEKTTEEADRTS
jgi:hypothetical protein